MRVGLSAVRSLGIAVSFALLAAACSAGAGSGGDASNATIGFITPSDGATVSIPFDVQLNASEPLGEPSTGNRHAHIYFDTNTDAADYDIVYGTTWQVTRQLAPGAHKLILALANPDHSLAGPTQEITVTVAASGGGSGGASGTQSEEASPTATPPPIDY